MEFHIITENNNTVLDLLAGTVAVQTNLLACPANVGSDPLVGITIHLSIRYIEP